MPPNAPALAPGVLEQVERAILDLATAGHALAALYERHRVLAQLQPSAQADLIPLSFDEWAHGLGDVGQAWAALRREAEGARWFSCFPEIRFPDELDSRGFDDESYRNDACGKATLLLADGRMVVVWVDHDEPRRREVGGSRFTVLLYPTEDARERDAEELAATDDAAALVAALEPYMALRKQTT